jgi:hypothetical protein
MHSVLLMYDINHNVVIIILWYAYKHSEIVLYAIMHM